jgi:UDP-N-acetyl-D-glucosamine dehydrogenase
MLQLNLSTVQVDYYDPYVPVIPKTREHRTLTGRDSLEWDLEQFAGYDAVLIATDHDPVDHAALARGCKMILDTRNACARAGIFSDRIVRA